MNKVILAIDDEKEFLSTLKDILETEGYDVKTLSDPTKTEEFIEKYRPDLLLMDVFMPKKTGFNLVEDFNARGVYHDLPKIFITCLDDDIEKMTARACGVSQYITKPFDPKELINRIEKILK